MFMIIMLTHKKHRNWIFYGDPFTGFENFADGVYTNSSLAYYRVCADMLSIR